jgi:hypothetical protein
MKYSVQQYVSGDWSTVEWGLTLEQACRMALECRSDLSVRIVPMADYAYA